MYKPHLDYDDILHDQPNNKSLCYKIETIQYYNATISTKLGQVRMLQHFIAEHMVFNYSYFQYTILEWNKFDMEIRRSVSFLSFKKFLLKIGWPKAKLTYNMHKPIGLNFLPG